MTSTKIMKSFDLEGEKTSYGLLQNDAVITSYDYEKSELQIGFWLTTNYCRNM